LLDEAQGLDGRWVRIDPVRRLEISAGEGIRLITSGALRWTAGFLPVTITVERLVLMLRPIVAGAGATSRLLFRPVLEDADLRNVPALLDRGIVGLVNGALEARSERLAWDIGRSRCASSCRTRWTRSRPPRSTSKRRGCACVTTSSSSPSR
jgi:hypothetical protein